MKNIEIEILNPEALVDAERAMLAAARLTQRGHKISSMDDFLELHDKPIDKDLVRSLAALPHPTIQKFGVINVMVVGLSRRALAQLTRHQNEVKFMAGSLQYSDYSQAQQFTMPPGLKDDEKQILAWTYEYCADIYDRLVERGVDHDAAAYALPQGFRTSLLISATPYQWKHMIGQRTCRRNTKEVAYIMAKIWKLFDEHAPELFWDCGPFCTGEGCKEGRMCCGEPFGDLNDEIERLING